MMCRINGLSGFTRNGARSGCRVCGVLILDGARRDAQKSLYALSRQPETKVWAMHTAHLKPMGMVAWQGRSIWFGLSPKCGSCLLIRCIVMPSTSCCFIFLSGSSFVSQSGSVML